MDTNAARRLARTLMTQHGVGHWRLEFDNAVRRFGQCRYGSQTISLSRKLVELNPESEVRDVILHEIAHAMVGPRQGHGAAWVRQARAIGYSGQRLHNAATPETRYVGKCPKCPAEFPRHRRMAGAFHPECVKKAGITRGQVPDDFKIVWLDRQAVRV
jgi:predicted SprT family Zn-dependent metalloprotease